MGTMELFTGSATGRSEAIIEVELEWCLGAVVLAWTLAYGGETSSRGMPPPQRSGHIVRLCDTTVTTPEWPCACTVFSPIRCFVMQSHLGSSRVPCNARSLPE